MAKKLKTVRELLAENVGKLMVREGEKLYSLRDVADSPNIQVGTNTVKRMADGTGDPKLGSIAQVAKFFGMEPWQLLHPDFDPDKTPTKVLSKSEADFYNKLLKDIRGLPPPDEPAE